MNNSNSKKIVLTGATGWVGQNFLHELQKIYSPEAFNKNVFAFGSTKKNIFSTGYPSSQKITIPIYPLPLLKKLINQIDEVNLIHTAFVTREKVSLFGVKKYIEINREIINIVYEAIRNKKDVKSIIISSGAAELFDKKNKEIKLLEKDPYGFLKLEEEKKFSEISNALILRIYGLTGKFIRDPDVFALSNFIISAINKKRIVIKSNRNVIRSYAFAGDIAKVGISWLNSDVKNNDVINASTFKINIKDLAQEISYIYNLPKVSSQINDNLVEDDYSCESIKFRDLLSKFGIVETSRKSQIIETYDYLKSNFIKS